MLPIALVAIAALVRLASMPGGSGLRELGVLLAGLALAAGLVAPLLAAEEPDQATREAVRFIRRTWSPPPPPANPGDPIP